MGAPMNAEQFVRFCQKFQEDSEMEFDWKELRYEEGVISYPATFIDEFNYKIPVRFSLASGNLDWEEPEFYGDEVKDTMPFFHSTIDRILAEAIGEESDMAWSDKCDSEIFDNGLAVIMLDGSKDPVQSLVEEMSKMIGVKMDWNYSGGRAVVRTYRHSYGYVASALADIGWEFINRKLGDRSVKATYGPVTSSETI